MKIIKTCLFSATVFVLGLSLMSNNAKANEIQETKVTVCNSDGATKYHYTSSCRGLSKCKHQIVTMTKSQAKAKGLGCCSFCCK